MKEQYEVHSDYGCALFSTEQDAVNATLLLAPYHGIRINSDDVKERLREDGYFEAFPLAIIK